MISLKEDIVKARVDTKKKQKAARVLRERGLSLSSFIRSMLYAVADTGRLPAPPQPYEPNARTAQAIRDAAEGRGLSGPFNSAKDLLADLET